MRMQAKFPLFQKKNSSISKIANSKQTLVSTIPKDKINRKLLIYLRAGQALRNVWTLQYAF